MIDEKQIQSWVADKTITQKQAEKMLADVSRSQEESRSNKMIVAASTVGALLLGIGAILFIASNWEVIPDLIKVLLALVCTGAAYYLGYLFAYGNKSLPKVGSALLFLGALLFGGTIFLIAQIYNVNANASILVLIWLIGILPLIYALASVPIAVLGVGLFYTWLFLLIQESSWRLNEVTFPAFFLFSGLILFGLGSIHYAWDRLKNIARTYRLTGIKVALIMLFLYTFEEFSGSNDEVGFGIALFGILALLVSVVNLFFNISKRETNILENASIIGIVLFTLLFVYIPPSVVFVVLFNVLFAAVVGTVLYTGYTNEDVRLVNTGMFWLGVFIIAKYFDFFWDMLPTSAFFMTGGLILVLGGIALERKRRKITERFK